jgi:hypothetical protein
MIYNLYRLIYMLGNDLSKIKVNAINFFAKQTLDLIQDTTFHV